MRTFRQLTKAEISDIIALYVGGEKPTQLAIRFRVDQSTIRYHVARFKDCYSEQGGIYAVLKAKAQKECIHPSSRCNFCGRMRDELIRGERKAIKRLAKQLLEAQSRLRIAGIPLE